MEADDRGRCEAHPVERHRLTSFVYESAHSTFLVLAVGLASFAGCLGTGALALRVLGLRWPAPFLHIGAVLLGLHLQSLAVQLLAMGRIATPAALIAVWTAVIVLGALGLATMARSRERKALPAIPRLALALLAVASAINLAAAVVPSSKIDEIYYVNLFAGRLVADQALVAYRQPIEAAILVQMTYAAAAAPLHALGFPDAPNVMSWALGVALVWFGWRLLRDEGSTSPLAYCTAAAILVGVYPLVFQTSGGSHAMGDLSLAAAVVGLAYAPRLVSVGGVVPYVVMMSLLSWSAASAKLSLFPVSVACLALAVGLAWRSAAHARLTLVTLAASMWLVFGGPIVCWDWLYSGSPFGPVLADLLGSRHFAAGAFQEYASRTRALDWQFDGAFFLANGAAVPALVWLSVLAFFLSSGWPVRFRWMAAALLLGQGLLIVVLLPGHVRFLGGLPAALAICCALRPPDWLAQRRRLAAVIAVAAVVPWLAGQIVYGAQFVPRALELADRTAFLRRHIALYDDFRQLDSILPPNAVLIAPGMRAAASYAPRPMLFDPADLPLDRPAYLLGTAGPEADGLTVGPEVYANPAAVLSVGRRWWVPAIVGELRVYSAGRATSLR